LRKKRTYRKEELKRRGERYDKKENQPAKRADLVNVI